MATSPRSPSLPPSASCFIMLSACTKKIQHGHWMWHSSSQLLDTHASFMPGGGFRKQIVPSPWLHTFCGPASRDHHTVSTGSSCRGGGSGGKGRGEGGPEGAAPAAHGHGAHTPFPPQVVLLQAQRVLPTRAAAVSGHSKGWRAECSSAPCSRVGHGRRRELRTAFSWRARRVALAYASHLLTLKRFSMPPSVPSNTGVSSVKGTLSDKQRVQ